LLKVRRLFYGKATNTMKKSWKRARHKSVFKIKIKDKKWFAGVVFIVMIAVFTFSVRLYRTFLQGNITQGEPTYLYLPHNCSYDQMVDSVKSTGRVKSVKRFKRAANFEDLDKEGTISPGRYKIKAGMNNRELARAIRHGWQTPVRLTISGNIRNMEKLASIIDRKIESDSATTLLSLQDTCLIDSLGFNTATFPCMFIPNTYELYWTATPKEVIVRMKKEYDKFWDEERLDKAKAIGLTPVQTITLASIVSEESNLKEEQPIIAGVYINRLHKGILLQADPTVKFALKDPSIKRILNRHLRIDSPYNTYKYKGLPPGPIVIPQASTIDAVLNYTKHKYFYFCAKPTFDGSHNFAVNIEQHNRNAKAYQKAIRGL